MGYVSIPSESVRKFKYLSGRTIYVYSLFREKLKYKKGLRGKLVPITDIVEFTYKEANRHGLGDKTFSLCVNRLIAIGLLEKEKKGKWGGRRPTEYKVR